MLLPRISCCVKLLYVTSRCIWFLMMFHHGASASVLLASHGALLVFIRGASFLLHWPFCCTAWNLTNTVHIKLQRVGRVFTIFFVYGQLCSQVKQYIMYLHEYIYKLPGKQYLGHCSWIPTWVHVSVMQYQAFIVQIQRDTEVFAVFNL